MKIYGLRARIHRKRKYSSYQGEVKKSRDFYSNPVWSIEMNGKVLYEREFSMLTSKKTLFVASLDNFSSVIIAYNLFTLNFSSNKDNFLSQLWNSNYLYWPKKVRQFI